MNFLTFVDFVTHLTYICPYFSQAKHLTFFPKSYVSYPIPIFRTPTNVKYRF